LIRGPLGGKRSAPIDRLQQVACVALCVVVFACAGKRPDTLGVVDGKLAACPPTPNCVSSEAVDPEQRVDGFVLASLGPSWNAVRDAVAAMPRTHLVHFSADYLHAEVSSAALRFVDDLELRLSSDGAAIAVRSASRMGRSDLGVNRARVEQLREALRASNLVR
jgi:uncharacterized protein (DUF1499 family)